MLGIEKHGGIWLFYTTYLPKSDILTITRLLLEKTNYMKELCSNRTKSCNDNVKRKKVNDKWQVQFNEWFVKNLKSTWEDIAYLALPPLSFSFFLSCKVWHTKLATMCERVTWKVWHTNCKWIATFKLTRAKWRVRCHRFLGTYLNNWLILWTC